MPMKEACITSHEKMEEWPVPVDKMLKVYWTELPIPTFQTHDPPHDPPVLYCTTDHLL